MDGIESKSSRNDRKRKICDNYSVFEASHFRTLLVESI